MRSLIIRFKTSWVRRGFNLPFRLDGRVGGIDYGERAIPKVNHVLKNFLLLENNTHMILTLYVTGHNKVAPLDKKSIKTI